MLPAPREIDAHDLRFLAEPSGPNAQDKPSLRVEIDRRRHFGRLNHVALRQQADRGAYFDPRGRIGRDRKRYERIDQARIELGDFPVARTRIVCRVSTRHHHVLRDKERFEAEVLDFARDCTRISGLRSEKYQYADLHRYFPRMWRLGECDPSTE